MPKSMTLTLQVLYFNLGKLNDALQRVRDEYLGDYHISVESQGGHDRLSTVIKIEAKKPNGDPYWDGDFIRRLHHEISEAEVTGVTMQEVEQDENCIQVVGNQ